MGKPHSLTSSQEVIDQALSEHHLSCPQGATPATVGSKGRVEESRKVFPICQPHPRGKVFSESFHISHDNLVIG